MYQDEPMVAAPLTFAVRVKPGASRTRVGGRYDGVGAGPALVVAVTARAVGGAALVAVAEALGVRRAAVGPRSGRTSRDTVLTVDDPPPGLPARLATLRDGPAR
jgi:uncharacterized protein YggU (UPF0235/DUF167 family)